MMNIAPKSVRWIAAPANSHITSLPWVRKYMEADTIDEPGQKERRVVDLTKTPGVWAKFVALDVDYDRGVWPTKEALEAFVLRYGCILTGPSSISDIRHAWDGLFSAAHAMIECGAIADRFDGEVTSIFKNYDPDDIWNSRQKAEDYAYRMIEDLAESYIEVKAKPDFGRIISWMPEPTCLVGYALLEFREFVRDPMKRIRRCERCGELMTYRRAGARLCSDRCRMAASRAARRSAG